MNIQDTTTEANLSAIDKALAAAKARRSAKDNATVTEDSSQKSKVSSAEKAELRAKVKAERDAAREARKLKRDAARLARKSTSSQPPHMKKIEKAAAALPEMNESLQLLFNEATTNFSASQLGALALHLQHFNRVKATERALSQSIEAGQSVRIIGGANKYVGMTGTIERAQRIRCFVTIPGVKKPVYLFTSDVELLEAQQSATGTEG
jgi:transcription antitermination factor NusG